jgi:hypothetical protein
VKATRAKPLAGAVLQTPPFLKGGRQPLQAKLEQPPRLALVTFHTGQKGPVAPADSGYREETGGRHVRGPSPTGPLRCAGPRGRVLRMAKGHIGSSLVKQVDLAFTSSHLTELGGECSLDQTLCAVVGEGGGARQLL